MNLSRITVNEAIKITHYCLTGTFVTVSLRFRFKKEGIIENNSYERRAYESVDDKSLSYALY